MAEQEVEFSSGAVVELSRKTLIRVLHVDDDNGFLKVAKQCLEVQGEIVVDTASSVNEALEKLKKKDYDAIVSDYQMPDKDGLEFLKELRQKGNTIPFIVFTGKGREEVAIKALNLGADQYTNKNSDPETVYSELAHSIRAAVEQKKTTERYRNLLESIDDSVYVLDREWRHVVVNEAAARFTHVPKERLLGNKLTDLFPGVEKTPFFEAFRRVMETRKPETVSAPYVFEDGRKRYYEVHVHPVPEGILCISSDVTERKQMEIALKQSEERFRTVSENTSEWIWEIDADGKYVYSSPCVKRILGYAPEEVLGKHFYDLCHPEDREQLKKLVFEAFAKKQPFRDFINRNVHKDGKTVWLSTSGAPMLDGQGTLLGYRGATRDVTEHRLMEQWYATIVKKASDGFWINDSTGRFIDVNDAYCRMIGYSREELLSMSIQDVEALEKPEETAERIKKIMKEGHDHFETRHRRKDGTAIDVEVSVNYYPVAGGQLVSFIRDVTTRKKDEQAVRESQQKFEALFRGNPEAAVYVAVDFRILDVNPRFCQLFGYAAQEVVGKSLNDVIVPENLMEEAQGLDKDAKDGYASRDTIRKRKDGSLVHVSVSAAPVIFENRLLGYVGIYKDITELKRAHEESEEARRHFQTLFNVMADPVVILDETGRILEITQRAEELAGFKREELLGKVFLETEIATAKTKTVMMKNLAKRIMGMQVGPYEVEILTKDRRKLMFEINAAKIGYKGAPADLVVFRDITERKKLEEKLRVVGSLTRHDVRNKLSAVTGNAYLLKRKLAEDPEALEQLTCIEAAVREVETILEFARTYEKLGIEQLSSIDVGEAFNEAVSLFSDLKGVKVVNECGGLTVLADSLLRQLFYNLIDNSLKYGEKTRQIRVYHKPSSADQLELVYEDDGTGIPDNMRSNLFKEGFTSGKGTGYGLFMIKRICEVYGWTIRETGKQGKGAQFTITIPKTNKSGTAYSTGKPPSQ